MTLGAMILFVSFIMLGRWQWGRAEQKQKLWDEFARGADAALPLDQRPLASWPRYQHVRVTGSWRPARQFLLDNRIVDGAAGYEALTPFALADGRLLLVNRGGLRFNGHREQLPNVSMAESPGGTTIQGRLDNLPSQGLAQGHAAPAMTGLWPRLTSYPTASELAAALEAAVETRILLLDANEKQGYTRRWQPPGVSPDTHWSYAIQWWCFAVLLLVLYVTLNTRRMLTTDAT
jgi:cytochrome oxidase assembly protein ShyY1